MAYLIPSREGPTPVVHAPPDRPGPARMAQLERALKQVEDILFADGGLDESEKTVLGARLHTWAQRARAYSAQASAPEQTGQPRQEMDMNPFSGPGGTDIPETGY